MTPRDPIARLGAMARPPRGGLPGSGEIAPAVLQAYLAYVTCPACGRTIRTPFSRQGGPVLYIHRSNNIEERLIVWPDPEGEDHLVIRVPHNISMEAAFIAYVTKIKAA